MAVHPAFVPLRAFLRVPGQPCNLRFTGRAGAISGRILDRSGKPAAGIAVRAAHVSRNAPRDVAAAWAPPAFTDGDGRYLLTSLLPGTYNVLPCLDESTDTARAVDSLELPFPRKVTAPDMQLIEGRVVHGQLLDAATHQHLHPGGDAYVMAFDDYRPNSGDSPHRVAIGPDGSFSLRVPSGNAYFKLLIGPPFYAEHDVVIHNISPRMEPAPVEFNVTLDPVRPLPPAGPDTFRLDPPMVEN